MFVHLLWVGVSMLYFLEKCLETTKIFLGFSFLQKVVIFQSKLGLSARIQTTQLPLGPPQHCHQLFPLCTPSYRILDTLLLSHIPGILDWSPFNFYHKYKRYSGRSDACHNFLYPTWWRSSTNHKLWSSQYPMSAIRIYICCYVNWYPHLKQFIK